MPFSVLVKVAEHSFQVLMPNSPFLLNYFTLLWRQFFARDKVNHRSIYSRILARVWAVAMATELVKYKAYKMVFVHLKEIQSLDCFHRLPTTNKH